MSSPEKEGQSHTPLYCLLVWNWNQCCKAKNYHSPLYVRVTHTEGIWIQS